MNAIPLKNPKNLEGDRLENLRLDTLWPHPQNPRKIERPDVIEAIAAQLRESGEFHPSHAITVRPLDKGYQIISGHNRAHAARAAGLKVIPAWVRLLDDDEAMMQLVLCNGQGELYSLERGLHALEATKDGQLTMRAYAHRIDTDEKTVHTWKNAAAVALLCAQNLEPLKRYTQHLSLIHAMPEADWPRWVQRLLGEKWSVEVLRTELDRAKQKKKLPIVKQFWSISDWEALTPEQRTALLQTVGDKQFNEQEDTSIEWARWSWNPVTGCLHNCPYCYARDIANHRFEQKFEPSFLPARLQAPKLTKVPERADSDLGGGYRNVFVCSMADLFGKWVPADWIEAVLDQVRSNPQWNFLFLTKFPQRMSEFEYPENAWLGTSIDLQARVKNAERAMSKVKANVRWLSLEPLLEPIQIDFSLFKWIVIGGATKSHETPVWEPPRRWVWDLTFAAQQAGCSVYHKTNLADRLRDYPGSMGIEKMRAPAPFQYLKVFHE